MQGFIDEHNKPRINIDVIGTRTKISLDAIIDTGFDGDICLPIGMAVQIGLELFSTIEVELGNGSLKEQLVFIGKVIMNGKEIDVTILLTSAKDALIGTNLLTQNILKVDFINRVVNILNGED